MRGVARLETVKWPFQEVKCNPPLRFRVILICAPFRDTKACSEMYAKLVGEGCKFMGISSYMEFPFAISNPHDPDKIAFTESHKEIMQRCIGWLDCSKDYKTAFNAFPNVCPPLLWSESDMPHSAAANSRRNVIPKYDFLYCCNEGLWNEHCRNFQFATECILTMVQKHKLAVLVTGRTGKQLGKLEGVAGVTAVPFQPYDKFIAYLKSCASLFLPNKCDASPRIHTEALALDLSVLGNADIYGGWKYYSPETGATFTEKKDFDSVLVKFLSERRLRKYNPRRSFMARYGNSGLDLYRYVNQRLENSRSWISLVDAAVYINLDHRRHDREPQLLKELDLINFPREKVHRMSAVYRPQNGHKGCVLSHIKVLELAIQRGWKTVWVIEDDMRWREKTGAVLKTKLDQSADFLLGRDKWQVFMLSGTMISQEKVNNDHARILSAQTADSYLVNSHFYNDLLANFKECAQNAPDDLKGVLTTPYALDQTWKTLQSKTDSAWFARTPCFSHQFGGKSDILDYRPIKRKRQESISRPVSEVQLVGLNKNFPVGMTKETKYVLENHIHFVWLGSTLPAKYVQNIQSYRKNTSYTLHLWADRDQTPINRVVFHRVSTLALVNQKQFAEETNLAAKCDILRYEIIYQFGGIYCDIDSVCLKPFDDHFSESFVSDETDFYKNITNAVFGFPKHSKFLEYVISALGVHYSKTVEFIPSRTGPMFFTTCLLNYNDSQQRTISQNYLVKRTSHSYTYHTNDKNW